MKRCYRNSNLPTVQNLNTVAQSLRKYGHTTTKVVPVVRSAKRHEDCVPGGTAANTLNMIPCEWSDSCSGRFPVRERDPRYSLNKGLSRPQSWCDGGGEKNLCPAKGLNSDRRSRSR
jgi:hypothetical protein